MKIGRSALIVSVLLVMGSFASPPIATAQEPDVLTARTEADWKLAYEQLQRTGPDFRVESPAELKRISAWYQEQVSEGVARNAFHTRDGSFIRCIDVASQPSFQASAAPGSQPRLAPGVIPRERGLEAGGAPAAGVDLGPLFGLDGSKDDGGNIRFCPAMTIPKLIPELSNLYHFRNLDEVFRKDPRSPLPGPASISPLASPPTNHEYAHAYEAVSNLGAQASFNLWSPFVEQPDEFSLSQLWSVGGQYNDSTLQSVEIGWQVYQHLYADSKAHLFIYSTSAAYTSGSGCYNLSCPRFVQTNSSIVLGGAFSSYSSLGGSQQEIQLMSYRDPASTDWWVKVGGTWVGYYPHSLYSSSGLLNSANSIDFGGEIVNDATGGEHTSTDMGSGHFPSEGFGRAAYIRSIAYFDLSHNAFYAGGLVPQRTNASDYDVSLFTGDPDWHTYIYFGGPGGAGGSSSMPNLVPYQPSGWSSKFVVSTSASSTLNSATDSPSFKPTDLLRFNWAVTNAGSAAVASRFFVNVYVDGALWAGQNFYADPPLNPGDWVYWINEPFGTLPVGTHTIQLVVDSTNAISESSELDNTFTRTITVGSSPAPCTGTSRGSCVHPISPGSIRVTGHR